MKLRMIGLALILGLLLVGCSAEKASQERTDMVTQQSEETVSADEQGGDEAQTTVPELETEQEEIVESETPTDGDVPEETEEPEVPTDDNVPEETEEPEVPTDSDVPEDTAVQSIIEGANLAHQLMVIYDNRADWYTADLEMGSYTVTDLDQNGKLEVMASVCMGSGLYTYTDIWEVDGDALVKCERLTAEYDSQADLIVSETVAYAVDGGWSYIFYDTVRMGSMYYYCDLRGVTLRDGTVTEQSFAALSEEYDGSETVLEAATADGTPLTEDEFYALKDNLLPGEKRQVTFRWINVYDGEFDLNTASEADAIAMFSDLYAAFGLA